MDHGNRNRLCEKCKTNLIAREENKWKRLCDSCLKCHPRCKDCNEHFVQKQSWATVCTNCYILTMSYSRPCSSCETGKISPAESDTVNHCLSCLKQKSTSVSSTLVPEMRQCHQCKLMKIYPKAPLSIKVCFDCKKTSKVSEVYVGKCATPSCRGVVDEKWKKLCIECFKNQKRGI